MQCTFLFAPFAHTEHLELDLYTHCTHPAEDNPNRCNATRFLLTCSADSDGSAQTCFQLCHDDLQLGSCKPDTDLCLEVDNLLVLPSIFVEDC